MILGIDPGKKGALVVLDFDGKILCCFDIPSTPEKLFKLFYLTFSRIPIRSAYIENVHAMPRDGVVSAFSFGKSFGILIAFCIAANIPYFFVKSKEKNFF